MHKHTHIHAHTNEHTRALTLEHKSVCVCVRIVKTKVTTRIITTAKKCNNQEKIQTQKQKKMCMLTGSSKTTGDENEMKTGAKLSSPSAVCPCLGVSVGVAVVVVVGDTCDTLHSTSCSCVCNCNTAASTYFYPLAKIFECFLLFFFIF